VHHQTEQITRDFKARLLLSGMSEAQVEAELRTFAERLRQSAERHVRLAFILNRIAAQESVAITEQELMGRLWEVAHHWKKDPMEVRRVFDAQKLWPSVLSTIRQEKTIALLLNAASNHGGST
jgi:FKBP-type peptidyl-prolyl cis-trans isomerase (trigger factor)